MSSSKRRTSSRRRKGIVAPGGGTEADVNQLSRHLGLRADAVHAILNCEGAGVEAVTPSSTGTTTRPSSAWADFMSEAGFDTTATPATTSNKRPRRNPKPTDKTDSKTTTTTTTTTTTATSTSREYQVPVAKNRLLKDGGILAQTGSLDATMAGRNKRPLTLEYVDLQRPTILTPTVFSGRKITLIATSCSSCHSICLDSAGKAYAWGRNEQGQCGLGTTDDCIPYPTPIPTSDTYMGAAVGKSHSILLSSTNHMAYAAGSNKTGQCGINLKNMDMVTSFRKCHIVSTDTVQPVQASCGENFSMLLTDEGHVYSCGLSEYGQLGNGETGEYFVTASKLAFANAVKFERRALFVESEDKVPIPDVRISNLSCGKNHTIAIEAPSDKPSRVFTWGCGDYGCLGHDRQADEYTPRLVQMAGPMLGTANGPVTAAAGGSCSMILTKNGHVYYWGKHRSVGEATMRPTLVDVLANNRHVVTTMAGGFQSVFCATNQGVTVSWGNGPHGELGYGKDQPKSSSKVKFVESLDKVLCDDIQCGYGHTLFLLRDNDNEDKQALKKLSTVEPTDLIEFVKVVTSKATTTVTTTTTTTTTSDDNNPTEEPKKKSKAGRPKKK